MDDDYDEDDIIELPARALSRLDLITFPTWVLYKTAVLVAEVSDSLNDLLVMHDRWRSERFAMAERAALEIEALTGGGEDG